MQLGNLDRVAVIGTSCAGKTTFARCLAGSAESSHVELDSLTGDLVASRAGPRSLAHSLRKRSPNLAVLSTATTARSGTSFGAGQPTSSGWIIPSPSSFRVPCGERFGVCLPGKASVAEIGKRFAARFSPVMESLGGCCGHSGGAGENIENCLALHIIRSHQRDGPSAARRG